MFGIILLGIILLLLLLLLVSCGLVPPWSEDPQYILSEEKRMSAFVLFCLPCGVKPTSLLSPTITAMTAMSSLCIRSSPLLKPTPTPFPSPPLPRVSILLLSG